MATCGWCDQDMKDPATVTCTANDTVEYPDGVEMVSLATHFDEPSGRCHDCKVVHGGKHHPGCDAERCPRCGGQLISCGCLEPAEPDDDDDDDDEPGPRKGE